MSGDNRTLKFQPGDFVSLTISGKVVGGGIGLSRQGHIVKHVRVMYGTPANPQYLSIEEDRLQLAVRPKVTAVRVTKDGEEPVEVPFAPVEKVDGAINQTARIASVNLAKPDPRLARCPTCLSFVELIDGAFPDQCPYCDTRLEDIEADDESKVFGDGPDEVGDEPL